MIDILQDRGYNVSEFERISFPKFEEKYILCTEEEVKTGMCLQVKKKLTKKRIEKTTVIWSIEEKLGDNIVAVTRAAGLGDDWITSPTTDRTHKAIVIVDVGITPMAKTALKLMAKQGIRIDVYTLQESLINVMKVKLVPKHEIISKREEKELLEEYGVTKKEIPEIKLSEPTMKHLSPNKGNIIRITRPSDTQPGEVVISYRVVR